MKQKVGATIIDNRLSSALQIFSFNVIVFDPTVWCSDLFVGMEGSTMGQVRHGCAGKPPQATVANGIIRAQGISLR